MPTSNGPLTRKPRELPEAPANTVLVNPTGEATPLHLPTDPGRRHTAASQHLGGEADYTGYTGTCPHRTPVLSVAVTKDDTLPVNLPASLALDLLRDEPSLRILNGPVLFLGPLGTDGQFTNLTDSQVHGIEQLLAGVRSGLRTPVGP
ncbi:hypothetical protein DR950_17715 [Kitasatospora xanthocidica]|uniref:Uncharacterized protein n=1 Tax=Kitasatospora xanthocidica TaxID=83382 RepID=A0A372ZUG2_9ACTN|nr:hypothetical protein [Kitasatospora xanthocidica]RGD59381.1 hypothetical protein DR950_17715 [Kitasatospora xanthocidica]